MSAATKRARTASRLSTKPELKRPYAERNISSMLAVPSLPKDARARLARGWRVTARWPDAYPSRPDTNSSSVASDGEKSAVVDVAVHHGPIGVVVGQQYQTLEFAGR
jgi:hypothetical protein